MQKKSKQGFEREIRNLLFFLAPLLVREFI